MPLTPRPETRAQVAARAKRAKIAFLKGQQRSWDDIGLLLGLEGETARKYFEKGLKRGEYEAPAVYREGRGGPGMDGSIVTRDPELAGKVLAAVVTEVEIGDDKFGALRQAMRAAGCPERMIKTFMARFRTTLAAVASEGKRLTLRELTEEIERKIAMNLQFMDEPTMAAASLKDLSINLSILVEKMQLLKNQPTMIVDFTARQKLNVLLPRMVQEARRRGLTLDGESERIANG